MFYTDQMILGGSHGLMISHTPKNIPISVITEHWYEATQVKETHEKFGLFGSDVAYNTFYPDVTPEQFNPSEDEFIEPTFRLLSAVIVAKGYMPTDFSRPGVLKNSMNLLVGQTVYCDHDDVVGNSMGAVKEVAWQNEYKDSNGIVIPAGINGVLKIDAKANPRVARGILMEPPSVHSNSVTVQFKWEPSHKFKDMYEFFDKIGTYDEKGELIRRIVTKIVAYKETSLVTHGADPFAQLIKDGKLNNPTYANRVYNSFSEDMVKKFKLTDPSNYLSMSDYKQVVTMYNTSKPINIGDTELPINNNQNQENMNELEQFLASLFGENVLSLAEGSQATTELALTQIKDLVKFKEDNKDVVTELATTKQSLAEVSAKLATTEATVTSLTEKATIGTAYLQELKNSTEASYKKTLPTGTEADPNIIALIQNDLTGAATLKSLASTYEAQLEEKFPMQCSACGSKDVSRASSKNHKEPEVPKPDQMSNEDIIRDIERSRRVGDNKTE